MRIKTQKSKVIKTPKQFAEMSSAEICVLLRKNPNYYIDGEMLGVDRCIKEAK